MSARKIYKINGNVIIIKEVKWFDKPADKKKSSCVSAKAIEPIHSGKGMMELIKHPVNVPAIKDTFTMKDLTNMIDEIFSKKNNAIGTPFVLHFPKKWQDMAITKVYEVTCDKCSKTINHYIHYKPSLKQLRKDCGIVRINNGKVITICEDCAKEVK